MVFPSYSSPNTSPIAPAATASAAIAIPVSATAPPVVTFVGQSIEEVLSDICVDVTVMVEFMVILLVSVELEIEAELAVEMVEGGRVVAELPSLVDGDWLVEVELAAASAEPAFVPQ